MASESESGGTTTILVTLPFGFPSGSSPIVFETFSPDPDPDPASTLSSDPDILPVITPTPASPLPLFGPASSPYGNDQLDDEPIIGPGLGLPNKPHHPSTIFSPLFGFLFLFLAIALVFAGCGVAYRWYRSWQRRNGRGGGPQGQGQGSGYSPMWSRHNASAALAALGRRARQRRRDLGGRGDGRWDALANLKRLGGIPVLWDVHVKPHDLDLVVKMKSVDPVRDYRWRDIKPLFARIARSKNPTSLRNLFSPVSFARRNRSLPLVPSPSRQTFTPPSLPTPSPSYSSPSPSDSDSSIRCKVEKSTPVQVAVLILMPCPHDSRIRRKFLAMKLRDGEFEGGETNLSIGEMHFELGVATTGVVRLQSVLNDESL